MEAFHSRLSQLREDFEKSSRDESSREKIKGTVSSRAMSEDHCINKIIAPITNPELTTFERYTTSVFDKALLSLWSDKYLSPQENSEILEMAKLLHEEMEEVFKENTWIDDKTRERAIEKLRTLTFNVGIPEEVLDEDEMETYHDQFLTESMDPNAFIENQVVTLFNQLPTHNLHQGRLRKAMNKLKSTALGTKYEPCRWNLDVNQNFVLVSANFRRKCIAMSAYTMLAPYLFDPNLPRSWNVVGAGVIIAHELGHAFEKGGTKWDSKGGQLGRLFVWTPCFERFQERLVGAKNKEDI